MKESRKISEKLKNVSRGANVPREVQGDLNPFIGTI
jgi:hypothetical protein